MTDVIFDLYGTLISIYTNENSNQFWKRISRKFKKYKRYTHTKLRREYLNLCNKLSQEKEEIDLLLVFEQLFDVDKNTAKIIAKDFRRISIKHISIYKGVIKLLNELKNKGYRIFLLSNAQDCFTQYELKKFKLNKYFSDIAISSNYGIKKPNIEFFKVLIEKNNIEDAIMIGNDYICDILPAQSLGLKTIYIETETSKETLNVSRIKGFKGKDILKYIISYS